MNPLPDEHRRLVELMALESIEQKLNIRPLARIGIEIGAMLVAIAAAYYGLKQETISNAKDIGALREAVAGLSMSISEQDVKVNALKDAVIDSIVDVRGQVSATNSSLSVLRGEFDTKAEYDRAAFERIEASLNTLLRGSARE